MFRRHIFTFFASDSQQRGLPPGDRRGGSSHGTTFRPALRQRRATGFVKARGNCIDTKLQVQPSVIPAAQIVQQKANHLRLGETPLQELFRGPPALQSSWAGLQLLQGRYHLPQLAA